MFRTSDAALIEMLYLTGITGTPENRGLHKTALGAQDTVRWEYQRDPLPVVQALKRDGYTIGVLEITDCPTPTMDIEESSFPLCLIVGNELHGVREQLVAEADMAFEIPQFGAKQSLNVAVAYGIAIFDWPDINQTSPTTTSCRRTVPVPLSDSTVNSRGSALASSASRLTVHEPSGAAVVA